LRHQRVAISLPHLHKEIRGAIERDMTVLGAITPGMTTGVGGVGDLLLRDASYLQSLLTHSVGRADHGCATCSMLIRGDARSVSGGPGNVHQGRECTWRREHSVCRCVVTSIFHVVKPIVCASVFSM